jgi:hypothetical protein
VLEPGHSYPQVAYAGPRADKNVGAPFANPSLRRPLVDALNPGRFTKGLSPTVGLRCARPAVANRPNLQRSSPQFPDRSRRPVLRSTARGAAALTRSLAVFSAIGLSPKTAEGERHSAPFSRTAAHPHRSRRFPVGNYPTASIAARLFNHREHRAHGARACFVSVPCALCGPLPFQEPRQSSRTAAAVPTKCPARRRRPENVR